MGGERSKIVWEENDDETENDKINVVNYKPWKIPPSTWRKCTKKIW